jgi:hypothetical protein
MRDRPGRPAMVTFQCAGNSTGGRDLIEVHVTCSRNHPQEIDALQVLAWNISRVRKRWGHEIRIVAHDVGLGLVHCRWLTIVRCEFNAPV